MYWQRYSILGTRLLYEDAAMVTYWALLMVIINRSPAAVKLAGGDTIETQVVQLYTTPDACALKVHEDSAGTPGGTHDANQDMYFTCTMVQIPR